MAFYPGKGNYYNAALWQNPADRKLEGIGKPAVAKGVRPIHQIQNPLGGERGGDPNAGINHQGIGKILPGNKQWLLDGRTGEKEPAPLQKPPLVPCKPEKSAASDGGSTSIVEQRDTTLEELAQMDLTDGDDENEAPEIDVYSLQLPPGIEYELWITAKLKQFVFELEVLVNTMFRKKTKYQKKFGIESINLCNETTCAVMKAGEFHSYSWSDGFPQSKAESVSAPLYIAKFLHYAKTMLADTYLFPTSHDATVLPDEELKGEVCDPQTQADDASPFRGSPTRRWVDPKLKWDQLHADNGNYWESDAHQTAAESSDDRRHKEFDFFLKQIMRRMYRVYCHIIRHHSYQLEVCNSFETMLKGFKRVILTVILFDLFAGNRA